MLMNAVWFKQIEVASLEVDGGYNKPYVKLIEAKNTRGSITAKIELHIHSGKNITPEIITIEDGDDLEQIVNRAIYQNMQIGTITCGKDNQSIEVKSRVQMQFFTRMMQLVAWTQTSLNA